MKFLESIDASTDPVDTAGTHRHRDADDDRAAIAAAPDLALRLELAGQNPTHSGARIAWTDAHDSWAGSCNPGGDVTCQTTHVRFACQKSGLGLAGQKITGCGQAKRP